ncbi:MAG TPA: MerR family transcriptional regulator [Bdellovibrionota bacterium]|nr:MerR family transcriptional regulator [Bdellovibrionota bacterium]
MKKQYPNKLFYKIGEVAEMMALEPYVLRYWEGEFNLKLTKSKNNQRLYQRKDIDQIERIKSLLYEEKFTIAGAKRRLRENRKSSGSGQLSLTLPVVDVEAKRNKEALLEIRKEIESILEILG